VTAPARYIVFQVVPCEDFINYMTDTVIIKLYITVLPYESVSFRSVSFNTRSLDLKRLLSQLEGPAEYFVCMDTILHFGPWIHELRVAGTSVPVKHCVFCRQDS